ncbi:hypothetical protein ACFLWW_00825 [Chloroflexota bacterium]
MQEQNGLYEVLNPWSEVDPKPLRGISPRLGDLKDKTIGFFVGWKIASRPILSVVEKRLQKRYPELKVSWFETGTHYDFEGEHKRSAEEWVKGVDAVVSAAGD